MLGGSPAYARIHLSVRKLTPSRRRWLAWRQYREERRRRRPEAAMIVVTGSDRSFMVSAGRPRFMPEVLCFDQNSEQTVGLLADLRRSLSQKTKGLRRMPIKRRGSTSHASTGGYRDFKKLRSITPAVALVLAAEYDRAREVSDTSINMYDLNSWDPIVKSVLQEVGFLALFNIGSSIPESDLHSDQTVLKMRSGRLHDPVQINDLVLSLRHLFPDRDAEHTANTMQLYDALTEAVANVVNHAYPENGIYVRPSVKRWWMTGAVDRKAGFTAAAVYDQGVSIPASLPGWERYGGVLRRMLTTVGQVVGIMPDSKDHRWDGRVIEAAVEESVSSTGKPGRGHGLAQIRRFVDACRSGHLRILSRHGEVIFHPNEKPMVRRNSAAIGGTLVEWSVLL